MAFFKLRWPGKKQEPERVIRGARGSSVESVEAMRRRARHRLIGATLLVLAAILGFPLLFDTQPRPVAVNASIEIPDKEKVAALAPPPPEHGSPQAGRPASPNPAPQDSLGSGEEIVQAPRAASDARGTAAAAAATAAAVAAANADKPPKPEARSEARPEAKPEPKTEPKAEHKPEPKPEPKPKQETKPKPKPEPKPEKPKSDSDDADRIRALMEGRAAAAPKAEAPKPEAAKPEAPAASRRYVVQVGAFADADKAAEVRAKLQMAGVSAFTQSVNAGGKKVVRVRVGPFGSKEEADKAAARVKAQGLSASLVPM